MNTEEVVWKHLGFCGAMICGSKSFYNKQHPNNLVAFNANVCIGSKKVWWGDLDITLSKINLTALAVELGETVYVLFEMDGRFNNEEVPLIDNYIVKFSADGLYAINDRYKEFYTKKLTRKK